MFWFRKKKSIEIGFEFNKNGKPPPPSKVLCPAKVSIIKYKPINFTWETTTDNGLRSEQDTEEGEETVVRESSSRDQKTSEAAALKAAAKLSVSVVKTKPITIEPIKFTNKIKRKSMIFSHRYYKLRKFFWEKAKDTCEANIEQVINVLKEDLKNHIANMQKVYDVRIEFEKATSDIKEIPPKIAVMKNERNKKKLEGKNYTNENDRLVKLNDELKKLQEDQARLTPDYKAVTETTGKKIGKEIVSNMVARMRISLKEIEKVKSFYKQLWKTMYPDEQPPQWIKFDLVIDEASLIESTFAEQIIKAMCQYRIKLTKYETFEEIIDDLRGET